MIFWLSFADPTRPKGSQFLGALIIEAQSFHHAVQLAHTQGVNPGGEVQGLPVEPQTAALIDPRWKDRLLTRAECESFDQEIILLQQQTGTVRPEVAHIKGVCPQHNRKMPDA